MFTQNKNLFFIPFIHLSILYICYLVLAHRVADVYPRSSRVRVGFTLDGSPDSDSILKDSLVTKKPMMDVKGGGSEVSCPDVPYVEQV